MERGEGFTLVELLIATLVASMLIAIAAPTANAFFSKAHMKRAYLTLTDSFLLSNRVSVSSGANVVMCPIGTNNQCVDSTDWSKGWLVFVDRDDDRDYGPDDSLMQQYPVVGGDVRLRSTDGRRRIVFQPDGDNAGTNLTFTLCSKHTAATTISLSNLSKARVGLPTPASEQDCLRD